MTTAFDTLKHLVKPDAPLADRSLLDKRVADEAQREIIERRPLELGDKLKFGAPEIPGAQLVFSIEKGTFGVAVQGFHRVVQLPKGYAGQGLELEYLGEHTFLVLHPTRPTLILEPPGSVRRY